MGIINRFLSLRQRSLDERSNKLNKKLIIRDMPYMYSLLAVAASSGLSAEASLRCISSHVPLSLRGDVIDVIDSMDAGYNFREAMVLWENNEHLRPLAHILMESMESGANALPALDALTRDSLSKVRRYTEVAMKQLPISMLFPLVLCILPAFMMLSVVPTLISGFMSFHW